MINIICSLFFSIFSCSFGLSQSGDLFEIVISPKPNQEARLSEFIKELKYVQLETTEESVIGFAGKILISNGKIFIGDSRTSKSLFAFDMEGKFLYKIVANGQGPREFISFTDFAIQPESNNIFIWDGNLKKFVIYSSGGKFLDEFKPPIDFSKFEFIDKSIIAIEQANISASRKLKVENQYLQHNLLILDLKGKIISKHLPFPDYFEQLSIAALNPLDKINDILTYIPPLSNTIYQFVDGKAKKRVEINFGKNWPTNKYFKEFKGQHPGVLVRSMSKSNYVSFLNYQEISNCINVSFYYKHDLYNAFYSKNSGNVICFNQYADDINCGGFNTPIAGNRDRFIMTLEPFKLKEYIKEVQNNNKPIPDQLLYLNKVLKLQDNPILVFFSIK